MSLERLRLSQEPQHLGLDDLSWYRRVELFRGTDSVAVVDTFDCALRGDAFLEAQICRGVVGSRER